MTKPYKWIDGGKPKHGPVFDLMKTSMGDSILRKTDRTLSKGEDVIVCLPGARIEHVTERVENVLEHGQGGSILVHVGTNNADRDGTTRIVKRYRELVETLKKTRV